MRLFAIKTYPVYYCLLLILLVSWHGSFEQLNVDFSMDKQGGCSPLAINFTNKTTGASPAALYTWDFGNGNVSSQANGAAIYTDQKTYTITLTVRDGANQSSKTGQVTVYSPPSVDFAPSVVKGCLPLTVVFTSASSPGDGSIASYVWDFGDGSTQTGYDASQSHVYNVVELAPVSLTIVNNYGCHTTVQKPSLITIRPGLNANFSADKKVLCLTSDPVQFSNSSNGPGTLDYAWDFGDGHGSTQINPQYVFNKQGIYSVKLTVHSSEGCTAVSDQTNYLNVASYSTDFDVPGPICKGSAVNFNSKSTPVPDAVTWEVDGFATGYYYGSLGYVFNAAGTHAVTLDNVFGTCKQSVTKPISVKDIPNLTGFEADIAGNCGAPVTVNFKDATPGATAWDWDFNYNYFYAPQFSSTQQAPSYKYTGNGQHVVWLTVSNADGCSSSTTQVLQINPPFVGIYISNNTSASSCGSPITASFASSSTDPLTSISWDFGDGGKSTDPAPTHTFSGTGNFWVSLTYTTKYGCQGTTNIIPITITPPIKVDFSAASTTICGGTNALFTAIPNDPNIIYWTWDYGDGTPTYPTGSTAFHSYSTPGVYTIRLNLGSIGGCDTMITKTNYITVLPPFPKISGFTNTCDSTRGKVSFTQSSYQATSLSWDFGDGSLPLVTAGDVAGVNHVYTKTGKYLVELTATNGQCAVSDLVSVPVLLKQSPLLTGSTSAICNNDVVAIKISNLETNPNPYNSGDQYAFYKTEYKDGTAFGGSLSSDFPGYAWIPPFSGTMSSFQSGESGVRIILVSADFGCMDTTNFIPLTVKGAAASFNVVSTTTCFQNPVVFSDNSQASANNPILNWYWDFGDGQATSLTHGGSVSHTYASPGSYPVRLTTHDGGGCSSSSPYTQYINVDGPQASFVVSGSNVPLNTTVYFYNYTNNLGSYNTVYLWDFGDGTGSSDFSPSHTYANTGSYTVTLTATGPTTTCNTMAKQTIIVNNFNSAFGFTKNFVAGACPPVLASFTNTSVNYSSVSWDFGDGNTADNLNYPSHVYAKPGKYIITLTVYAPNGVTGQFIDSINIPAPEATVTASPLEACIGGTVGLSAKAANTSKYLWDFGDGSIVSSTDTFAHHVYLQSGQYKAALLMQDGNGCAADAAPASPITIRPNPVINFSPAKPLVCLGEGVSLESGNGGSTYTWSPSAGLSDDKSAAPTASPSATSVYTLIVADDIGCSNSASLTVTVVKPGTLSLGPDTAVCAGSAAQLHASGESIYQWIGVTDGLDHTGIGDPVARPSGTTLYTVTGSDVYACFTDTASMTVRVLPLPVVNAGPDVELQAGATTTLDATGSPDIIQWAWSPSTYLSCHDCASPFCIPLAGITYTVTAKNQDGCVAIDAVVVKIDCEESHVAIPNAFTPNGDGDNDVFIVKGISIIKHMVIYSRWGEKVYERNNFIAGDRASCWDGTYRGQKCPTGVYVYYVEMECPAGGQFTRNGSVVLIR